MSRLILICSLYLIWLPMAFSQQGKEPKHIKEVDELPAAIYDVKGMGNWKSGEDYGQIRLVIARTEKRDEIYLQWVRWLNKRPHEVISTVMIKEIQLSANYLTKFIRRETVDGKRQIVLGLENKYDKSSSRATINVTGIGRYTCTL